MLSDNTVQKNASFPLNKKDQCSSLPEKLRPRLWQKDTCLSAWSPNDLMLQLNSSNSTYFAAYSFSRNCKWMLIALSLTAFS